MAKGPENKLISLSADLAWRGLIKDKTFTDIKWLDQPRVFYHGVDASSADSLTIGNLAALLLARRLAERGWRAVLLVGGATSLIGDPGGKTAERALVPRSVITKNVAAIKKQVAQLFAGQDFKLVDNFDWFKDVGYLEFLRDIGKHYSMTELMARDFVVERMGEGGSGISYAEFSYSLIQGYDYWQLYRKYQTELQIGGSDQWGNMLSGVPLIRKKEGKTVQALSMPLVVDKATGRKFGKSEAGAVWLDPAKTSPTEFYQFWLNVADAEVENYLKVFTFLSRAEIEQVMAEQRKDPKNRAAQKRLAAEVTKLVHGQQPGEAATGASKYLTGQASLEEASAGDLERLRAEIPALKVRLGDSIIDALAKSGLAASKTDARRLLMSGAVYLNGRATSELLFKKDDFQNGRLLLRRGKAYKDSALVELE